MGENIGKMPTPWEQRKEIGIFKALWGTIRQVLFKPGEFFDNLEIKPSIKEPYLFYLAVGFPVAIVTTLFSGLYRQPQQAMQMPLGILLILTIIILPIGIFITSAVMHLGVLIFGGKGGYKGSLNILAYATSTSVFSLIPFIGGLIGAIWYVIVIIKGFKRVHNFSTTRAICAYIFNPVIIIAIIALFAVIAIPNILRARISSNETLAQATLKTISTAAESYAAANNGQYPKDEYDLKLATPPYITQVYDQRTIQGYSYSVRFMPNGYEVVATPQGCSITGKKIFTIATKGKMSDKSCE